MSQTILKPDSSMKFPEELIAYSKQRSELHRKQLDVKSWKSSWLGRLLEKLVGED